MNARAQPASPAGTLLERELLPGECDVRRQIRELITLREPAMSPDRDLARMLPPKGWGIMEPLDIPAVWATRGTTRMPFKKQPVETHAQWAKIRRETAVLSEASVALRRFIAECLEKARGCPSLMPLIDMEPIRSRQLRVV